MKICKFKGDYFFLSNFYEKPVTYKGLTYDSTEAAFQAAKCKDESLKEKFCNLRPGEAKRLGRQVELRDNWEMIKLKVMYEILEIKFKDSDLRTKLVCTEDWELIEGNSWGDTFWGVCKGKGENHLGKILMSLRDSYYCEF